MTPTEVAAPADSGGGDVYAELGTILNEAAESIGTEEAPSEPARAAAPEAPTAETPAPAQDAPAETATGDQPYQLTEDGNGYIVPKAELATINGMKQYADQVQAHFPTAQDAEIAHKGFSDFKAIMTDYLHGDVEGVLKFWAGDFATDPNYRAESQQAFTRMAEKIPDVLKSINPEAHGKFTENLIQSRVDAAYQRAAESGDKEDLLAAQRLDWGLTGQYKTDLPKHDPMQAERDRLTAQARENETREKALVDRDWTSFNKSTLDGPKWGQFNSEIDKTLAPVKDKFDPIVFEALRDRVSKSLIENLQKDFEFSRNHENERRTLESAYRSLWKQRQSAESLKPRIQAYTNDFMARVRRHLPSIAAPLINKTTASPAVAGQPKPPATPPKQPNTPRAANGQFQQQNKPQEKQFYNIHEDPEFLSAFKVN